MLDLLKGIRTFVFDVDGVLTDGSLLILNDGQMARSMNIKDGYALQLAVKMGYRVIVISGGTSEAVRIRLERLGIKDVYMEVKNKVALLNDHIKANGLNSSEILFMGDDIPDLECMQIAGFPCCPEDAVPEIKSISKYISHIPGGKGCVRDVIEKVLKLNGHWSLDTKTPSL